MDSGTTSAELFNFIYLFLDRINMGCMYSDLEFIYLLQQVVSEPPLLLDYWELKLFGLCYICIILLHES